MQLTKATEPTFYFIGVTTAQSSIMKLFPEWAKELSISQTIKGIDISIHAEPHVYREVVEFLKNDELSLGALVTTHKIDLYHAAKDLFDELDPYAKLFNELSCISKRNGKLIGHAKDHLSSGLAMKAFIPEGFWEHKGEVFIMGAGGSAIAITANLIEANQKPSKIYVTNRSKPRLKSMEAIIKKISTEVEIEYVMAENEEQNDKILQKLRPYSFIINATGLGKDRPGSPLSSKCTYPCNSFVWELNYRGELLFMHQAMEQRAQKNLYVEDGWVYFIHGWTQVISEVFQVNIDQEKLSKIEKIASDFINAKTQ